MSLKSLKNKEQIPVRQSIDDVKKSEKFRKIQRIKTEKMVNQIAQNNPEKLGEASMNIINRIDNKKLQKNNIPEEIAPDYKNRSPDLMESIEKPIRPNPTSEVEAGDTSHEVNKSVTKEPPKKAPTFKVDMPGAAVITRNVISYNYGAKGKTTRDSNRKSEHSDSDYGKSTNVIISKSISVKPGVQVKKQENEQTNRYTDANTINNVQTQRRNSPTNLNGLLEDIDDNSRDVFGNPRNDVQVAKFDTKEDDLDEQKLLKELDESSIINDSKPQSKHHQVSIMNEMNDIENTPSGFHNERNIMNIDSQGHDPINLSDSVGKFGEQLPIPQHKKAEKEEEPPSPNQFVLDDLMDEFGESKGADFKPNIEVNKKESEKDNDFLAEFEW
eukprot:CAMPEP_0196998938 /NCGR_PEP_ID=MMETSP1380-20130617/4216_1 /TAXON_ID=5936 /ORGANISM="Euplotes crassus, Strain CT5" /LENGTH=384 /DNA_ID=CAMNT_0042415689 /DNA_START=200 /DNA_END=1354 /DNA_ORIENTATION=-